VLTVVTTTMSAAVLSRERVIEHRSVDRPEPGPGELLVRVSRTGICGSDLATYAGHHPYKSAPVVLGHEFSGHVVRVGAAVEGFTEGDRVCSAAFSHCGECVDCGAGATNRCTSRLNLSHLGWEGSFAEYVLLRPNMAFRLPAAVDDELGALVEPLSIGLHAVRLATGVAGGDVVVLGTGGIGLSCLVAAVRLGARSVTCVDIGTGKRSLAMALGAKSFVDGSAGGALSDGADVVLVTSGHPDALAQAAAMTRPGGEVVVVSYFDRPQAVDLNPLVSQEVVVRFSALSTAADFTEVIGWLERGEVDPRPMVTHRFPLAAADQAMQVLAKGGPVGKVVLAVSDERSGR